MSRSPNRAVRAAALLALAVSTPACSEDDAPDLSKESGAGAAAAASAAAKPSASGSAGAEDDEAGEVPPMAPPVNLSGENLPLAKVVGGDGPRVYARKLRAYVYKRPTRESRRLGYLRAGASSPTSAKPAGHEGCKGGWYPVEPRGYVCVGTRATLDGNDPVVQAMKDHPPDPHRKLPYIYGTVRRAGPMYARLPTDEQVREIEKGHDDRMDEWLGLEDENGAQFRKDVWMGGYTEAPDPAVAWKEKRTEGVPSFLADGKLAPGLGKQRADDLVKLGFMKRRVGYAFLKTFLWNGRRYGVNTHLEIVPADRLRPIEGSDFHGYEIGKDVKFPFIIVRSPVAKFWTYTGSKLIDGGTAPYRSAYEITGKQKYFRGKLHYETKDGKWISDRHASRLDPAKRMPAWGKRGEKWIDVNLTKQTVVLYEGEKAVYATLISSGEAGLEDPKHTTATKRGIFRIHTKHVTATMSSDEIGEAFELNDVPYVQYFDKEGYALHGAYWHDRFGVPKSHGCLNLSPEDARRIFYWTDPPVPAGWHGAMRPLTGTVLFIHP